ncbi:MAG: tetratricopeptide (TPR) repeat protein [Halieaceae bacterium]|jgi:tetratricopeptide (TPR) repeat protein
MLQPNAPEDSLMSKQRPRSSTTFTNILAASVLAALSTGLTTAHAAEPMQLKTSDREVYGTRDIESGQYAAGIEKLEIALARSAMLLYRAPILNNLCVAYVATAKYDSASTYCDMAVESGYDLDLAYNNRGVLNYSVGNVEDGIRDFEFATKLGKGYGVAKGNLARALGQEIHSSNR